MSLRNAMLAVLAEGPASGYEITKAFDASLRYFWSATHQQIYRDLKSLAADGLVGMDHVVQSQRPDKIVYRLTSLGQEALQGWVRHAVQPKVNSEILIKAIAAAAFGPSVVIKLLEEQREIHLKRLENYRAIEREFGLMDTEQNLPLTEIMRLMTLRRGIRGEEDWLGWIDEALVAIGNAASIDQSNPAGALP